MTNGDDAATGGSNRVATALLGAAAGAFGVWALDRLDWAVWDREGAGSRARTTAVRPGGEPPAQALASKAEQAAGVATTPGTHELFGQMVHYAIGVVPAIGYALLRHKLPGRGPTRGVLYGLGLFVVEDELLNPLTGLAAKPAAYPWQAHARGFFAHLLYGIATEFALNAAESRIGSSSLAGNDGPSPVRV